MRQPENAEPPVLAQSFEHCVNTISARYDAGDYVGALRLIDRNLIEAFYGFRPEQLRMMFDAIIDSGVTLGMLPTAIHQFLSGRTDQNFRNRALTYARENPTHALSMLFQLGQTLELRLGGRSVKALPLVENLVTRMGNSQTLFDARGGWDLLISLQSGVTAMLAGDPKRALVYLTAAQLHPHVPTLIFLTRDAYVKSALVHAAFGSADEARRLLAHAASLPRGSSWAQPRLDATQAMAEALIETETERALDLFRAIPLRAIGEFWPYYALTLHRVLTRAGHWKELGSRMRVLEKLPLPKEDGIGFTGSVLPLVRASVSLVRNDPESARWFVDKADRSYLGTQLVESRLDLALGRPQSAIKTAWGLGESVKSMRQYELQRYAILAAGYIRLGHTEQAQEVLQTATYLSGSIRGVDLEYFDQTTREFAATHVDGWPAHNTEDVDTSVAEELDTRLTGREREILRMLAHGNTRAEMSDRLFVTVNTLKTHLKAIYKKLGVSSRDSAVIRAEREGWL